MNGSPDWTWWVLGALLVVIMLISVFTRLAPASDDRPWRRVRYRRRQRSNVSAETESPRALEP